MSNAGRIRCATENDYDGVNKLLIEFEKERNKANPSLYKKRKQAISKSEFVNRVNDYGMVVSEYNGEIIGAMELKSENIEKDGKSYKTMIITRIYVKPKFRKIKCGSGMIAMLNYYISGNYCDRIEAELDPSDVLTHNLLQQNGFNINKIRVEKNLNEVTQ